MTCTYITFSTCKLPNFIPIHCDFLVCKLGAVPVCYPSCVLYSSTSMLFMLCAVQQHQYATHAVCCTAAPVCYSRCVCCTPAPVCYSCCVCCTAAPVCYSRCVCCTPAAVCYSRCVCCTAVPVCYCTTAPTAHSLHLYCLFQCTFTRYTVDFSFPSPTDAAVHPVPILNGLNGYKNRQVNIPTSCGLCCVFKDAAHQLNFQTSTAHCTQELSAVCSGCLKNQSNAALHFWYPVS